MDIVLDVNIVLSALIKDSATRKILIESDNQFYFPEPELKAIQKYKQYVITKTGLTSELFETYLSTLFKYIILLSEEKFMGYWDLANQVIGQIDKGDVIILAVALSLPNSAIWSNDKDFEKQTLVPLIKTKELTKYL